MEELTVAGLVERFIEVSALVVDIGGSMVMLTGFVLSVASVVVGGVRRSGPDPYQRIQETRCTLGGYLALGLELMIISDVLHTVVTRSLEDLAFLGGLVVIRTVIAFFLGREIKEIHEGMSTPAVSENMTGP